MAHLARRQLFLWVILVKKRLCMMYLRKSSSPFSLTVLKPIEKLLDFSLRILPESPHFPQIASKALLTDGGRFLSGIAAVLAGLTTCWRLTEVRVPSWLMETGVYILPIDFYSVIAVATFLRLTL